ncbi:MAG: hypothetical protein Q9179_002728 [Wetmoreana sp. 5 TL-2023]
MTLCSKIKKHFPGRSKKKPGGGANGKDGNSSLNQPPDTAQPTASDTVAVLPSQDIDPWIRAYEILKTRQPELTADYERHLGSLQVGTASSADLSTPRFVKSIVKQLLKDREDKQWQVSLLGKDIKIREQAEKLVKFLLWTDPIVKNAVSAQPYAALAWSGVSLLLPLLTSGTTQNEAMLKGFSSIGHVQLYWEVFENKYPRSKHQQDYQSLIEPLAELYSQVIEYQAYAICHLSKAQLSRAWDNVAGSNDWDSMAKEIEKCSEKCSKIIHLFNEGEIREHWESQLQKMQESQDILGEIRRILEESRMQTIKVHEDQKEKELLQGLVSDYEEDKNFNPQRVEGTCEWFFNDDRFRKWRDGSTSGLLWVTAGPGCGKSVLSRALIDERRVSTNVTTSTICYFFFKDGDERRMHSTNALSAMLHQLFIQDSFGGLIKKALPSHKNYGKSLTQNFSELWRILVDCGRSSDTGEVVCILDALDECNDDGQRQLIDQLKEFYLGSRPSKLKFLITSRPYDDLEASFDKFSGASTYLRFDGDDKSEEISKEINLVINDRVGDIARGFADVDRDKISERLKLMENRTYLWLHLTLDAIKQSGSKRRSDVESVLAELSEKVSDKYEKILGRSKNQAQTEILLRIVLAAARPLTVEEANVALTLALRDKQIASHTALQSELWPRENFQSTVKNLCGLFISVHNFKLSFIHQTAREFLLHSECQGHWKGRLNMPNSHSTTLQSCLYYLVLQDVPVIESPRDTTNGRRYPFLNYAAKHWPSHFSKHFGEAGTESEKEISELALRLCDTRSKPNEFWYALYVNTRYDFPWSASSLIITAYLGFETIVKQLLDTGEVDIDSKDDNNGRTPLSWAARYGHEAVVEQLLNTGKVDINLKDKYDGRTPLSLAAQHGHEAVVKQLLDTGKVDIDWKDNYGQTPLSRVAEGGYKVEGRYEAVVKQLLDTGKVDIDLKDNNGRTPLSLAAKGAYKAVIKQLLNTGKVDINSKDNNGRTPLSWVVRYGHEAVVEQLLNTGKVDIDLKDNNGRTPLSLAVQYGYKAVVKQLLNTGKVDIDLKDNYGQTPLSLAAKGAHKAVIKQLLNTGKVDINLKDNNGRTPLSWAAEGGYEVEGRYEAVVKQLLDTGKVDIDLKDNDGRTPLSLAAEGNYGVEGMYEAIVKQLLDIGKVDIDSKDNNGRTPLSWVVEEGYKVVIKQLLNTGKVDIESKDNDGRTPLSWAAEEGHEVVVKQLLDTGKVDIESKDNDGRTPLSWVAECRYSDVEGRYEAIVKQLLDTGKVDIDSKDNDGRTPLSWAAKRGREAIVEQLRSYGAS